MPENPPDWAIERAVKLVLQQRPTAVRSAHHVKADPATFFFEVAAFARYIAEHEEPPVDPLLIEARKLCAARYAAGCDEFVRATLAGEDDNEQSLQNCLIALRRGIEIERERAEKEWNDG